MGKEGELVLSKLRSDRGEKEPPGSVYERLKSVLNNLDDFTDLSEALATADPVMGEWFFGDLVEIVDSYDEPLNPIMDPTEFVLEDAESLLGYLEGITPRAKGSFRWMLRKLREEYKKHKEGKTY